MTKSDHASPTKAVGLISGGLDSFLAARLIRNLGWKVHGLFFCLPFGCDKLHYARAVTKELNIPLEIEYLGDEFIRMIRHPQFGRGTGMNPCIDCHILMLKKAAAYMHRIQATFVFTGEVLGQRPMSQLKNSLSLVEKHSGLEGRLLRPLCAAWLPPTVMEELGMIDRRALLDISGRSRKKQYDLARQWDAKGFAPPAGGCSLTDRHFSRRLQDLLEHGYRTLNDLKMLRWGRHYRLDKEHKAVLGRDEFENQRLLDHVTKGDYVLDFVDENGPTLILNGPRADDTILSLAAGLIQYHSRYRDHLPLPVTAIRTGHGPTRIKVIPEIISEKKRQRMRL